MLNILVLIEKILTNDKSEFKYWLLNKMGYRFFRLNEDLYRELCTFDDGEGVDEDYFNATYVAQIWVYDPTVKPGTYRDSTGLALYQGYGVEL